jgi:diadenosine tetraphosphate (Ap4A) HIT family hydrolase
MNAFTLWENDSFTIKTPDNPHIPYTEGAHIIVAPKQEVANAWTDVELSEITFRLASRVCQTMEKLQFAPWFNIQANGNWGLLPGGRPFFHVHVYGRNKTKMWGKPVALPEAPGTYQNDPMPESDRAALAEALKSFSAES